MIHVVSDVESESPVVSAILNVYKSVIKLEPNKNFVHDLSTNIHFKQIQNRHGSVRESMHEQRFIKTLQVVE